MIGFEVIGELGNPTIIFWQCDGIGELWSRDFKWGPKRQIPNPWKDYE